MAQHLEHAIAAVREHAVATSAGLFPRGYTLDPGGRTIHFVSMPP